jgi:hypothetical protein
VITAWDYPFLIIAGFIGALLLAVWIMRAGTARGSPAFACEVCGRSIKSWSAREWRYCPYCGVPREAKDLRALPRKRSLADDISD